MGIRREVFPHIVGAAVIAATIVFGGILLKAGTSAALLSGGAVFLILGAYLLYFFRDPERTPPGDPAAVVAAADGKIAAIVSLDREDFGIFYQRSGLDCTKAPAIQRLLDGGVVRISIFLSLFDVHVNRAPISGTSQFLGYFPGRRWFTFQEKSSTENQRNAILMRNPHTVCLVQQIVGPVARRVVYWPDKNRPVDLKIGDRFGMMKFGSRLDMYFPEEDIEVLVRRGDTVAAGESVVARLREVRP